MLCPASAASKRTPTPLLASRVISPTSLVAARGASGFLTVSVRVINCVLLSDLFSAALPEAAAGMMFVLANIILIAPVVMGVIGMPILVLAAFLLAKLSQDWRAGTVDQDKKKGSAGPN